MRVTGPENISVYLKIFPFKTKFHVINGPFKAGFTVVVMYNITHVPFTTSKIIQIHPPHHFNNLQASTHSNTIHNQHDNQV
jgi:hypothetical protein